MAASLLPLFICLRPPLSGLGSSRGHIRMPRTAPALAGKFQPSPPRAGQKSHEVRGIGEHDEHEGLPKEFLDAEWQAQQREKTREWHAYRKKEEEKEKMKDDEYREIGLRLKGYPEDELREARKLVSSFIKAEEEVEAGHQMADA